MNGIHPRLGIVIELGSFAPPYFFIGWTDVNHLVKSDRTSRRLPEYYRHLAKPFFPFLKNLLYPLEFDKFLPDEHEPAVFVPELQRRYVKAFTRMAMKTS